jgi:hypothetical protein
MLPSPPIRSLSLPIFHTIIFSGHLNEVVRVGIKSELKVNLELAWLLFRNNERFFARDLNEQEWKFKWILEVY